MLVPEHLVKQWFKPSSRVYQNFSYLFQNPLWNKPLPKGFTVCPYFWLSMFSMFIFRPIIVPFCLFIGWLLKLGGKPFAALDRGVRKFLPEPFASKSGSGLGALVLTPLAILVVLVVIGVYCTMLSGITTFKGKAAFINLTGFGALAIACGIYAKINENKSGRIKVAPVILGGLGTSFLIQGVINIGAIVLAVKWLGSALWWLLAGMGSGLWIAVTWGPFWNIPFWLDMVVVFGVTYLVAEKLFNVEYDPYEKDRDYTIAWENFLIGEFKHHQSLLARIATNRLTDDDKIESLLDEEFDSDVLKDINMLIAQGEFYQIAAKLAKKMSKVPFKGVSDLLSRRDDYPSFERHMDALSTEIRAQYEEHDLAKVTSALKSLTLCELRDVVVKRFEEEADYRAKFAEMSARWKAAKLRRELWEAKLDALMQKAFGWTTPIRQMFARIGKGIMTFFAYLWMLIVAWKKGACPYFRFEEQVKDYYE